MADLILALIIIGLHGYWIYAIATYDWSKFDKDSKDDDFLKPLDKWCIQGPKNQQLVVVEDAKAAFGSPIGKHWNAGKNWAMLKMYDCMK